MRLEIVRTYKKSELARVLTPYMEERLELVRKCKKSKPVRGTHLLKGVEVETNQDI